MKQEHLFNIGDDDSDDEALGITIQARFEEFHQANPHVYNRLVALSRQLVRKGHERLAIGMLWEVLRFERADASDPTSDWSLNDHYRSRYARLIMARERDLADVFETRKLRSD